MNGPRNPNHPEDKQVVNCLPAFFPGKGPHCGIFGISAFVTSVKSFNGHHQTLFYANCIRRIVVCQVLYVEKGMSKRGGYEQDARAAFTTTG